MAQVAEFITSMMATVQQKKFTPKIPSLQVILTPQIITVLVQASFTNLIFMVQLMAIITT
jgi:hypothetical protein